MGNFLLARERQWLICGHGNIQKAHSWPGIDVKLDPPHLQRKLVLRALDIKQALLHRLRVLLCWLQQSAGLGDLRTTLRTRARVDIWHARHDGLYSDEELDHTQGQTWLRGYQLTDNSGYAIFQTIYPGKSMQLLIEAVQAPGVVYRS